MEPFATAILRTHLVLIAIVTACLVYALSPHDARYFYAGQIEARSLANFDTSSGDPTRSTITSDSTIIDSRERIAKVANDVGLKIEPERVTYRGLLERRLPTQNSPLIEWKEFVNSPNVHVYTKAPDDKSIRLAFELAIGGGGRPPPQCVILSSRRLEQCSPLIPGARPHLMQASVESLSPESGGRALGAAEGQQKYMFVLLFVQNPNFGQLVFSEYGMPIEKLDLNSWREYFLGDSLDLAFARLPRLGHSAQPPMIHAFKTLFSWARKQAEHGERLPLPENSRFKRWFPTLTDSWEDVSTMKPLDAANFFRAKETLARQSLSIAGQTLDERILSFAGPIAILVVSAYLLFNLIAMRAALRAYVAVDSNALQFPWFGLSTTGVALWFTRASVLYLPTLTALALWIQSDREINAGIVAGAAAVLTTALVGWRSALELRRLRADLTGAISFAVLKARAARRAEILARRAARKAKRTGEKKLDSPET